MTHRAWRLRGACLLVCGLTIAACSKDSPAGPSGHRGVSGRTVSVMDSAEAANIDIRIGTDISVQSDTAGFFETEVDGAGRYPAVLRGGPFVERRTTVQAPAEGLKLTLIPSGFDLQAFDEMCRTSNARLQRWTSRPRLVIITSVMRYTSSDRTELPATAEQMSHADVEGLIADLRSAFALLTAGTWHDFESIERLPVAEGSNIPTIRSGAIVAGRIVGMEASSNTIGYGRWGEQGDGTVVAGAIYLDRDYDTHGAKRNLLRMHELGHALGYMHVTSRTSIMNPAIGPEPTDFDRQAVRIVFNRPPGNRTPDEDPAYSNATAHVTTGGFRISPPIP